jgi:arginase
MTRSIGVIGVPTSAGAFAPGQERAPRALREAGLLESLRERRLAVHDHGDRPTWRWRPDRESPRAQNLAAVVEIVRETANRVAEAADAGEMTLVLGGDCTVGIGTVAGHVRRGASLGLVHFDAHADLNVPESVHEGALDWMGVAHMLGEPGACPPLVGAGGRTPLLEPEQVVLLGWDERQATALERATIERNGIGAVPLVDVEAGPDAAAEHALELLPESCDRVLVHFDVDVIDFTEMPLSEHPGRNEGLAYGPAMRALSTLLADARFAGMTVTELNPDHAESPTSLEEFARALADALTGSVA